MVEGLDLAVSFDEVVHRSFNVFPQLQLDLFSHRLDLGVFGLLEALLVDPLDQVE